MVESPEHQCPCRLASYASQQRSRLWPRTLGRFLFDERGKPRVESAQIWPDIMLAPMTSGMILAMQFRFIPHLIDSELSPSPAMPRLLWPTWTTTASSNTSWASRAGYLLVQAPYAGAVDPAPAGGTPLGCGRGRAGCGWRRLDRFVAGGAWYRNSRSPTGPSSASSLTRTWPPCTTWRGRPRWRRAPKSSPYPTAPPALVQDSRPDRALARHDVGPGGARRVWPSATWTAMATWISCAPTAGSRTCAATARPGLSTPSAPTRPRRPISSPISPSTPPPHVCDMDRDGVNDIVFADNEIPAGDLVDGESGWAGALRWRAPRGAQRRPGAAGRVSRPLRR